MNGLDKIKARILGDAETEAQSTVLEAQAKAKAIKDVADSKKEKLIKKQIADSESAALEHKKRLIAKAELEYKKNLLAIKRQVLEEAFNGAIKALKNLPEGDYVNLLKSMLVAQTINGDAEIIFSKEDAARIDKTFIKDVNELLEKRENNLRIISMRNDGAFLGGFILKGDGFEINHSLEALTKLVRDETESIAAQILFSNVQVREVGN